MKITNINPLGDVAVAVLGMKLVKRGDTVDVPDEVAGLLLVQSENWEPADDDAKAVAEAVIPEHLAALEAASIPADQRVDPDAAELAEQPAAGPSSDDQDPAGTDPQNSTPEASQGRNRRNTQNPEGGGQK